MLDTGQRQVAVADLHESTFNPRTIEPERLDALKKAMRHDPEMLKARPIIATVDGEVVAGNMRHRAAKQMGWETIETFVIDLDSERAREWMTRDNNPYGEYVEDQLARLVEAHVAEGGDPELLGFTTETVDGLLESLKEGDAIIPDADEQSDPDLASDVMVEVYATHEGFAEIREAIDAIAEVEGVTVNVT